MVYQTQYEELVLANVALLGYISRVNRTFFDVRLNGTHSLIQIILVNAF